MITLESSNEEIVREMEKIRVLYKLKQTMRYDSTRNTSVHSESVAEHLFAMMVIAQYFLDLEDPKFTLDRYRINELILYHELGEIETGDIPMIRKQAKDRELEKAAAERVVAQLPERLQKIARERYHEFEAQETPEARFAGAVDKIEPMFEMLSDHGYPLFKVQGYTREIAIGRKMAATENFPYMRRFLDAWTAHMDALDAFAR